MPIAMNVVGARPQFVKAGPVSRALHEGGFGEILVHTGQHYDDLMSDSIMADVGLREPDVNLGVGSESHAVQTARMLEGIERLILERKPDLVLTYGDTNSTIAAALAAAKLGVFTAHVEAGLRSFNREMPEELNRIATDHLSDLLLAPTDVAMGHLANEGLAERSVKTGDVMVDALLSIPLDKVILPEWTSGAFYAATIHRPSNTDEKERLRELLTALGSLDAPVHLLAHPRLQQKIKDFDLASMPGNLRLRDPLPYSKMLATLTKSRGLITDSGGLQKEAFVLGIPCTTIRDETEWPETLEGGWNVLAGSRLSDLTDLVRRVPDSKRGDPYGNGEAARTIVGELSARIQ
jgi:UDP-N-acetylglucosamine 2-epimerase (non-hydrolysing)